MKSFVILLLKIAGILLILNFILLLLIRNFGSSRFEDYYRSVERISAEHYDLLITGDSHANDCWRRIDTVGIADLSFPGDNYVDIVNKLRYINQENIRYDVHLIEVDPQVFSTYRESTNNNDLSSGLRYGRTGIWIQMNFPLFFNPRIETEIMSIFQKEEELISDEQSMVIDTSSMSGRASTQFLGLDFSEKMINRFAKTIDLTLEGEGLPVFIHYPFYPSYLAMVDTSSIYKMGATVVDSTLDKNDWVYLNYRSTICDPRFFYNQDHVNKEGAKFLFGLIHSCLTNGSNCDGDCSQKPKSFEQ